MVEQNTRSLALTGDFKDGWGVLGSADAVGDLTDVRA